MSVLIQNSKNSSNKSKIEVDKDDPKIIWKIFDEFGASSKQVEYIECFTLMVDGNLISDQSELADICNEYFENIASKLKEPIEPCAFQDPKEHISAKIPENVYFKMLDIDENLIFKFLSTLDVSKSTGSDSIGLRLLKMSSPVITNSITFIAQKCNPKGYFPSCWKEATVNPLYKGDAKDETNNYRPISMLPILSKLLAKFIQQNLMEYLNDYDVLHRSQSGFRSGHCTETALTLMTECWLKAIMMVIL